MPTVSDYEDARWEIIQAFHNVVLTARIFESGDDLGKAALAATCVSLDIKPECAVNHYMELAFDTAHNYGWNHEEDGQFTDYCLKATDQEIAAEGLRRALTNISLHTETPLPAFPEDPTPTGVRDWMRQMFNLGATCGHPDDGWDHGHHDTAKATEGMQAYMKESLENNGFIYGLLTAMEDQY